MMKSLRFAVFPILASLWFGCAADDAGLAADAQESDAPEVAAQVEDAPGKLPHVKTTDGPGPWGEVVKVKSTPPGGWLIYPKDIGKNGVKHPIFVFGPGGGTTPQTYDQQGKHWDRYGSYGFVIYVLPRSTGDGKAMKAGLDWVLQQNTVASSPLYGKLDTDKIAVAGHSMGSITTFDFLPDPRITTSIHISGGSGQGAAKKLTKTTMFISGEGGDPGTPNADKDFRDTTAPTYYAIIKGSTHMTSGRLAWEAIIAWLHWQLADHEEWKKEFDQGGKFHQGIYKAQLKNWK
jgi:hypothetical protein